MPFQFPPYQPPDGGPHYWQKETTGRLREAVTAYFTNRTENTPVSPADCELVADYIRHWIHAPVWDLNPYKPADDPLANLRAQAAALTDADSIDRWIHRALESGIDPF